MGSAEDILLSSGHEHGGSTATERLLLSAIAPVAVGLTWKFPRLFRRWYPLVPAASLILSALSIFSTLQDPFRENADPNRLPFRKSLSESSFATVAALIILVDALRNLHAAARSSLPAWLGGRRRGKSSSSASTSSSRSPGSKPAATSKSRFVWTVTTAAVSLSCACWAIGGRRHPLLTEAPWALPLRSAAIGLSSTTASWWRSSLTWITLRVAKIPVLSVDPSLLMTLSVMLKMPLADSIPLSVASGDSCLPYLGVALTANKDAVRRIFYRSRRRATQALWLLLWPLLRILRLVKVLTGRWAIVAAMLRQVASPWLPTAMLSANSDELVASDAENVMQPMSPVEPMVVFKEHRGLRVGGEVDSDSENRRNDDHDDGDDDGGWFGGPGGTGFFGTPDMLYCAALGFDLLLRLYEVQRLAKRDAERSIRDGSGFDACRSRENACDGKQIDEWWLPKSERRKGQGARRTGGATQKELLFAEAPKNDGGVQGLSGGPPVYCDGDGDVANEFYVWNASTGALEQVPVSQLKSVRLRQGLSQRQKPADTKGEYTTTEEEDDPSSGFQVEKGTSAAPRAKKRSAKLQSDLPASSSTGGGKAGMSKTEQGGSSTKAKRPGLRRRNR